MKMRSDEEVIVPAVPLSALAAAAVVATAVSVLPSGVADGVSAGVEMSFAARGAAVLAATEGTVEDSWKT